MPVTSVAISIPTGFVSAAVRGCRMRIHERRGCINENSCVNGTILNGTRYHNSREICTPYFDLNGTLDSADKGPKY